MAKAHQGFTDEAAQKDLFEIRKYIDGLTRFIETCNTPMTISIQGSWGTGKTSIMQIIKNNLDKEKTTQNIWFNTWQFSQFNLEEKLPLVMLGKLVSAVADKQADKVKQTVERLFEGIGRLAIGYVSGGASNGDDIKNLFTEDFIGQMDSLKSTFQSLVDSKAGEDGRVVIFVDDLDRLEPRKAVELLEVLKLFLDCQKCVFVLAIDYDVVCRGVATKYGNDMDEQKGRSFFDKIIQVPFKMPVAEYNIKHYITDCFEQIGIPCSDSEVGTYENLIKYSIGTNPRSMKRLFNSYLLLTIVVSEEVLESDKNKQLLFAVLCLQSSFEKTYNYIVTNRNEVTMEDFNLLKAGNWEEINQQLEGIELTQDEADHMRLFMEQFIKTIDSDNDGKVVEKELEKLRNVLGISTITASGDDPKPPKVREVGSLSALDLNGRDYEETKIFVDKIMALGEGVDCSYRNTTPGYVRFAVQEGGDGFADLHFQKKAYVVDCMTKTATLLQTGEVGEIVKTYDLKVIPYGKYFYVRLKVNNPKSEADCLQILKACYQSYA